MRFNGKPTDLSAVATVLWLPMGFCGACLFVMGLIFVGSILAEWRRADAHHAIAAVIFLLLGSFCLAVSARWFRRLYGGPRKPQL